MCEFVNISEEIETPIYQNSEKLIDEVYNGEVSVFDLPPDLYEFSFFALSVYLASRFGLPSDFKRGSLRFRRAIQMKNNLSIFSGAKTFQHILELSSNVFTDGVKTPFNEFKNIGLTVNERYNKDWLATEQQAAFSQSQSVEQWLEVTENSDIFPYLRYSTVFDSRVRPEHQDKDGIVKRVDDPFWNTWFPPNGWNCRCIVEQLEESKITQGSFKPNEDPVFGTNVGKTGIIFPKKHPYYNVPREFKDDISNNFGFKTPTDEQIKERL